MRVSCKTLTIIGALVFAGGALALPTSCGCKTNTLVLEECKANKVQSPSWWGWITNNKSSQLHFFQLIELLHTNDAEDTKNTSAKLDDKKLEQSS